jgi:hypothetical protein
MLTGITTTDGTWVRAHEAELKLTVLQMLSSTVTKKTQGLIKSVTHEADDHFGICGRCACVLSHSAGSDCECAILQVISALSQRYFSYGGTSRNG